MPNNYHSNDFISLLKQLEKYKFCGVELNIVNPEEINPQNLKTFLNDFGLKLTMYATGADAKSKGLSLSSVDEDIRLASVKACVEYIDFASELGSGIILGFIKGGVTDNKEKSREQFLKSIIDIEPHANAKETEVLLEATNHYESDIANSLKQAYDFISFSNKSFLKILPDTYHMNIEEANIFGALSKYKNYFKSIHISDNNRFFPSYGAIDFKNLIDFLYHSGYNGGLAIEGNDHGNIKIDIEMMMNSLAPILNKERFDFVSA